MIHSEMIGCVPLVGMHIMEGFLPPMWAVVWFVASLPFWVLSSKRIRKIYEEVPQLRLLLAMMGALVFVLSAMKIPSVTGSCSHPTGIALGAILFGPLPMVMLGTISLLFQAILLAHGGLTTLGANTFSMAVVGSFAAWGTFVILRKVRMPVVYAVFFGAVISDWATYLTTALQLAAAFPSSDGGFFASAVKFISVFGLTQIPIGLGEACLAALVFNLLLKYNPEDLRELGFSSSGRLATKTMRATDSPRSIL